MKTSDVVARGARLTKSSSVFSPCNLSQWLRARVVPFGWIFREKVLINSFLSRLSNTNDLIIFQPTLFLPHFTDLHCFLIYVFFFGLNTSIKQV